MYTCEINNKNSFKYNALQQNGCDDGMCFCADTNVDDGRFKNPNATDPEGKYWIGGVLNFNKQENRPAFACAYYDDEGRRSSERIGHGTCQNTIQNSEVEFESRVKYIKGLIQKQ
jgi:hypothetical protein